MSTTSPLTKAASRQPPRPPNSWILYRRDKQNEILLRNPEARKSLPSVSKVIGEMWRNEPEAVKMEYKRMADELGAQHQIQYPDYKYQPRARGQSKKSRRKTPYDVPQNDDATASTSVSDETSDYTSSLGDSLSSTASSGIPTPPPFQNPHVDTSGLWFGPHSGFGHLRHSDEVSSSTHPVIAAPHVLFPQMSQPLNTTWQPAQMPPEGTYHPNPYFINAWAQHIASLRANHPQMQAIQQLITQGPSVSYQPAQNQVPYQNLPTTYYTVAPYPQNSLVSLGAAMGTLSADAPIHTQTTSQDTLETHFMHQPADDAVNTGHPGVNMAQDHWESSSFPADDVENAGHPDVNIAQDHWESSSFPADGIVNTGYPDVTNGQDGWEQTSFPIDGVVNPGHPDVTNGQDHWEPISFPADGVVNPGHPDVTSGQDHWEPTSFLADNVVNTGHPGVDIAQDDWESSLFGTESFSIISNQEVTLSTQLDAEFGSDIDQSGSEAAEAYQLPVPSEATAVDEAVLDAAAGCKFDSEADFGMKPPKDDKFYQACRAIEAIFEVEEEHRPLTEMEQMLNMIEYLRQPAGSTS